MTDADSDGPSPWSGHFPGPVAAFAIAFAAWLATATVVVLVGGQQRGGIGIVALGIGQALGLGVVATLAARRVPEPRVERLGLRGFPLRYLLPLAMLLPLSIVVSELVNVAHSLFPPPDAVAVTRRALERLDTRTPISAVQVAIVAVGIAPVVEEFLYRGVLQQGLVAHLGRTRGVLLAACLFGLAHVSPGLSGASALATFVATLPLGLALGAVRLATGSLLAPILLHACNNALGLLAVAFSQALPVAGFNAPGAHTPLAIVVPCAAVVALALHTFLRDARLAPVALPIPEGQDADADAP